jgi:uncharacterized phage protein (TIGR01671 family)
MEREIKFRLWDKQEKEMVFEGFHVFGEITLFNAIGNHAYETKGERTSLERYNDFEIMQFTGKQDQKGVDIYEGDIIEFDKHEWGGDDNIHVVSWDENAAAWDWGGGGYIGHGLSYCYW